MIEQWSEWIFFVILVYAGWKDLKTRQVSRNFLLLSGGIGVLFCICLKRTWIEIVAACGIGLFLLGLSWLTGGKIGEGDGWFFVVSGLFLRWKDVVMLFVGGLVCSFLAAMIILLQGKIGKMVCGKVYGSRKKDLPFLTFLVPTGCLLLMEWV